MSNPGEARIQHVRAKTLTLHWHEGAAAIYSVGTQPGKPGERSARLVTGGGDNNVRIWKVNYNEEGSDVVGVEILSSITKHTQAVNCVRFNSTGDLLATASDDGTIMIWEMSDTVVQEFGQDVDDDIKESWVLKVACFASNMSEIYDICWSPDSKYICCGLMDNIIRIFSVVTGSMVKQIAEHSHYVQGVAWDPRGDYICSQSADRSVHVYKVSTNESGELVVGPTAFYKSVKSEVPALKFSQLTSENLSKSSAVISSQEKSSSNVFNSNSGDVFSAPASNIPPISYKQHYLYHNETLQSFFRRLTFSPDGSILVTTCGIYKPNAENGKDEIQNTVYVYTRAGLNKGPVVHLPGLRKPAIVVRFSPVRYALFETSSNRQPNKPEGADVNVFSLPYRMLFAIATQDSILIYDTQRLKCVVVVTSIHYAVITDVAWSSDGRTVFVSSNDGFISCVVLGEDIVG
ncbi:hypothetical protein PICMEDRAFT_38842, partial [Pichia membranifaciens NRRL Y-2026]